jgi:2-amino-4-hydroxy-6-hydroxymethyldihydropteridine diphosphokinase
MVQVFVAIGGNVGDTEALFQRALAMIERLGKNLHCSKFYQTKPVSTIVQRDFLNAVCTFETDLAIKPFFLKLEEIEKALGKVPKKKDEPRSIDLDLIFYGNERFCSDTLQVPHPRWKERSFVLLPLLDLIETWEVEGEIHDIRNYLRKL